MTPKENPKEKANELVNKCEKLLFNRFTQDEEYAECVECALFAVVGILEELSIHSDNSEFKKRIKYWQKVNELMELL
jgi:hypothetical protein